jgi:hypothetical protein
MPQSDQNLTELDADQLSQSNVDSQRQAFAELLGQFLARYIVPLPSRQENVISRSEPKQESH